MSQAIGKKIEKKLLKRNEYLADRKKRNAKNAFIEKFVLCEICCKSLIADAEKVDIEKVKLYMPSIRKAMKKYGYTFDEDKLKMLFSGKSDVFIKRGSYSAKNLRDSIMHDMSVESMQEVFDREKELHKLMDDYLKLFSSTKSKQQKRQRRKSRQMESGAVLYLTIPTTKEKPGPRHQILLASRTGLHTYSSLEI